MGARGGVERREEVAAGGVTLMLNQCIEFHDSVVLAIDATERQLTILMDAYVHQSEGRPGVDPGVGGVQQVRLELCAPTNIGDLPQFPATIVDGLIRSNSTEYSNCIPLPLDLHGEIELEIRCLPDMRSMRVIASCIRSVMVGQFEYVEEFSPARWH